jgi:nucleotide-binding universal stress UspA family protein
MRLNKKFYRGYSCLIQNVLVAVDGSENSERALAFALDFAEKYGAALTVLNVSELPAATYSGDGMIGDGMVVVAKDLHKLHEDILEKAVARVKTAKPHLPVSSVLREGDPAVEIVALSKEEGFDVVVIGHQGVGKVKGIFLGSISEKVARSLPCTVIIVR